MIKRYADIAPDHPGKYLSEFVLPDLGVSKSTFALHLGISRQMLMNILAGNRGISPLMAVRLGRSLGNDPRFWLNLQQSYDLWHAERKPEINAVKLIRHAQG